MTIVLVALVLFLVTTVHEAGHALAVLVRGGRVTRIQIGRGPAVLGRKTGNARAVLALLPLGGRIHYEGIRSRTAEAVVAVAGPFANLVLAVTVLWGGARLRGVARMPFARPGASAWDYGVEVTAAWLRVVPETLAGMVVDGRASELRPAVRALRVVAEAGSAEAFFYMTGALSALWAVLNMLPVPGIGTDGWRCLRALFAPAAQESEDTGEGPQQGT